MLRCAMQTQELLDLIGHFNGGRAVALTAHFSRISQPAHTLRSAAVDTPACAECDSDSPTSNVHELRGRPRRAELAGKCKDTKLIKMQTTILLKRTLCSGLFVNLVAVCQKFGVQCLEAEWLPRRLGLLSKAGRLQCVRSHQIPCHQMCTAPFLRTPLRQTQMHCLPRHAQCKEEYHVANEPCMLR